MSDPCISYSFTITADILSPVAYILSEENARLVGKLGAIRLMLKLLSERSLEDQDKTQIVLTLAHSADMYGKKICYSSINA